MEVVVKSHSYLVTYVCLAVLGFIAIFQIMPRVLAPMYYDNVTYLANENVLILKATGPVDVLAYSTDSKTGARLFDKSGQEVMKTLPEITPGNFAAKGVLYQGEYTLKGERTVFVFSGEGFGGFENPGADKTDTQANLFVWLVFCLVEGIFVRAMYQSDKRRSNVEAENG